MKCTACKKYDREVEKVIDEYDNDYLTYETLQYRIDDLKQNKAIDCVCEERRNEVHRKDFTGHENLRCNYNNLTVYTGAITRTVIPPDTIKKIPTYLQERLEAFEDDTPEDTRI